METGDLKPNNTFSEELMQVNNPCWCAAQLAPGISKCYMNEEKMVASQIVIFINITGIWIMS